MNLTSTSELTVASGFHWLLMSQDMMKRSGGSQTTILPIGVWEPSSATSYQRPPRCVSITTAFLGVGPMPWLSGHQRPSPAVNTSKACAWPALTRMLLRTGAIVIDADVICDPFDSLLRLRAEPPPAPDPRTDRATRAARPALGDRCSRRGACLPAGPPRDPPP